VTEDHDAGLVEKVAKMMCGDLPWSWIGDSVRQGYRSAAVIAIAAVREHDAHRDEGR